MKSWVPPSGGLIKDVRVRLQNSKQMVTVRPVGSAEIIISGNKQKIDQPFGIKPEEVKEKQKLIFSSNQFFLDEKKFRGNLEIIPAKDGSINVVNILPLEEYVMSVVPSEMPKSFSLEALKAQAVCARTYVVESILVNRNKDYHLDASTASQVYKGMKEETSITNYATSETKGIIVTSNNKPIKTFFHSNSGGVTENAEAVWGSKLLYAVKVDSPVCKDGENYSWELKFSAEEMDKDLASLGVGTVNDIKIVERTTSGRAASIQITGDFGTRKIKANEFRKLTGNTRFKSLLFEVRKDEDGFIVEGRGYGHGVGLSQWGAQGLAKKGNNYDSIIKYYYKNVELAKIGD